MLSLVHRVIIMPDSEGPMYQVRGDRSVKCLGLFGGFFCLFSLGYAWLAKVILKGTWAPECHSSKKPNIHNAGECSHVIASSGAFRAVCIIPFFHKCRCARARVCMPRAISMVFILNPWLFLPPARCCVLFHVSRWLTGNIFPAAQSSLALSMGRGLAAQHSPGRQRALCCLLLPTAPSQPPHHTQQKGLSLIWAAQEIKGGH